MLVGLVPWGEPRARIATATKWGVGGRRDAKVLATDLSGVVAEGSAEDVGVAERRRTVVVRPGAEFCGVGRRQFSGRLLVLLLVSNKGFGGAGADVLDKRLTVGVDRGADAALRMSFQTPEP